MYTKDKQTTKKPRTHRVCSGCSRKRMIKFYEKPTSLKCDECKRKAKRLKKLSSKSYVERQQDKVWSEEVKRLAGYKCEYCENNQKQLNSHHIFSRSNKQIRHDVENGVCLCAGHHVFSSKFSAHKTPAEFIEWIKEYRGLEWYERLRAKARKVK